MVNPSCHLMSRIHLWNGSFLGEILVSILALANLGDGGTNKLFLLVTSGEGLSISRCTKL
jgi:hypothetical protein